jgi:hypothetical protein
VALLNITVSTNHRKTLERVLQYKLSAPNSTYPKGGVSCSKDSFVVNQTFVFQIKFCGKSPALRVAAFQDKKQAFYATN